MKKTVFVILISLLWLGVASSQQNKADGYKGIWFTLGQFTEYGDKYSGGLATYTANHIPMAVYAPVVKKTFFVYGGTTSKKERHLLIMISYFDHQRKMVTKPVIVYDKIGVDDPHDNASVSIDGKGYIWVFVSGRNTRRPGLIFKSDQPYSIESFVQIREGEITYPQPWWMGNNGFILLFTKYTNGRELYWTTSPDGKMWSPDQKLAGMAGHYQLSNIRENKLVTVFNYHPGGDVNKRTNLYMLQSDDLGKSWKTIDGITVETPVTKAHSEALVKNYEAEGKLVYLNDLNFDSAGNPVVLAIISRDHNLAHKAIRANGQLFTGKTDNGFLIRCANQRTITIWDRFTSKKMSGQLSGQLKPARKSGEPVVKWHFGKVVMRGSRGKR